MAVTVTPQPSFTPDASVGASFGVPSNAVLLPGTPANDACVRIANVGPFHVAVALSTSSTTAVTPSTGLVIPAGQVQYITIGSNTYISGVSCGGPNSAVAVNITTGN